VTRPSLSGVLAAAFCVLALAGCGRAAPEEVESKTVVPVAAEPARVGTIRASVHATGLVTPAPGADLIVVAPEAARVAEMPKAEGDRVRRGDLLVRFDIPSVSADAAKQQAEVGRAQARLRNAVAAQGRARDLFERGVAARKEVEDADRDVADAQADLAAAEAALTSAQRMATRTTVRATFDGVVAKRFHNAGDIVEAAASDPVLRVIDPRRLEVNASVPLTDVARVLINAPAHLTGGVGVPPVPLTVVSRPAAVDPGTAAVPVRLAFAAPTAFAAGTPVQIDIEAEQRKDVILIPASALVRESTETAVFVATGEIARRRPISVGISDEQNVEVRSGLKAGELVITRGHAGLPDGAAIRVEAAQQ
jgi:membrane fusion protein (multidrug efflux system)